MGTATNDRPERPTFGESANRGACARMQAAVCDRYGPPEVIQIIEVEKPVPQDTEVLVKVRVASVNPLDAGSLKGRPYIVRLMTGLRRPKSARPGVDVAGQVEAVGGKVTQFKAGDEVFGVCIDNPQASGAGVWAHGQGSFAEYVCAPEATLALKPRTSPSRKPLPRRSPD